MDPITTLVLAPIAPLVLDYAKGQLFDRMFSSFRTNVIERWTKHRAEAFFQQFCLVVASETKSESSAHLDQLLDEMLKNEASSEKLYDAYRSVCFSRSKELGPRIIAVLTAELVLAGRQAEWEENVLFWAAENLDDEDFREFSQFLDKHIECSKRADQRRNSVTMGENGDSLQIKLSYEQFDSQSPTKEAISVGPMDLNELTGPWAEKLRSRSILTHEVKEEHWEYKDDGEMCIDGDGTVREISWWMYLGPSAFRLRELIRLVDHPAV